MCSKITASNVDQTWVAYQKGGSDLTRQQVAAFAALSLNGIQVHQIGRSDSGATKMAEVYFCPMVSAHQERVYCLRSRGTFSHVAATPWFRATHPYHALVLFGSRSCLRGVVLNSTERTGLAQQIYRLGGALANASIRFKTTPIQV